MPWAVGQTVGYTTGDKDHRKVHKGVVDQVTPSGRATVIFTRYDGGTYSNIFEANGRPRGGSRYRSALSHWSAEDQKLFDAQQAEYDRRTNDARQMADEQARTRKANQDAIDYAIQYMDDVTDPRLLRAKELLKKWRPHDL